MSLLNLYLISIFRLSPLGRLTSKFCLFKRKVFRRVRSSTSRLQGEGDFLDEVALDSLQTERNILFKGRIDYIK